nr:Tn3 family transposase [Roseovarius mucosus]
MWKTKALQERHARRDEHARALPPTADTNNLAMPKRAMALNLVIAAITFWNTIYMDKAASYLVQTSSLYDVKLLAHTSPLGWEHVILSGDFDWHSGAADRKIARPLNIRPARDWGT